MRSTSWISGATLARLTEGLFTIHHRTAWKVFQTKPTDIKEKLARWRYAKLAETGKWLWQASPGWYQYYALPNNHACLKRFQRLLQRQWLAVVLRRSQCGLCLTWEKLFAHCWRW